MKENIFFILKEKVYSLLEKLYSCTPEVGVGRMLNLVGKLPERALCI